MQPYNVLAGPNDSGKSTRLDVFSFLRDVLHDRPFKAVGLKERLARNGWAERAEVIVFDPEVEIWAWIDSPRTAMHLGWEDFASLRQSLAFRGW